MKTLSLVWGILAILGMLIAFTPCLGAFNWLNIPFATIGLIVSIIAYTKQDDLEQNKSNAMAGIIMCGAAMVFGFLRLLVGGGIF